MYFWNVWKLIAFKNTNSHLYATFYKSALSAHSKASRINVFRETKKFFVLYFAKRFFALIAKDTSKRIVSSAQKHAACSCNFNRSPFFSRHDGKRKKKRETLAHKPPLLFYDGRRLSSNHNALSLPAAATTTTGTIYRHLIPPPRCDDYARLSFLIYEPEKFRSFL